MRQWKLCFVRLLAVCLFLDAEETVMKTISREPDVTPICSTAAVNIITLIVCKIITKASGGRECRLLYQHGKDFEHKCDSRFTLTKNWTVFLHLINLTPEDSGNYTCDCSYRGGINTVRLAITVEADQDATTSPITMLNSTVVICTVTASVIVATGLFLGLVLRKKHCRSHTRSGPSGLSTEDDRYDPYASLEQPESDLYQVLSSMCQQHHGHDDKLSQQRYSHNPVPFGIGNKQKRDSSNL